MPKLDCMISQGVPDMWYLWCMCEGRNTEIVLVGVFFEGVSDEAVEFVVNLESIYFSSLHQTDSCDGGR